MHVFAPDRVPEQGAALLASSFAGGLVLAVVVGLAALLCRRSPRGVTTGTFLASFGVVVSVAVFAIVMLRAREGTAGVDETLWGAVAAAGFVVLARWTWRVDHTPRRVRS